VVLCLHRSLCLHAVVLNYTQGKTLPYHCHNLNCFHNCGCSSTGVSCCMCYFATWQKSTVPTKLIWTQQLIVSAVEQLQSCVRSLFYEQKVLCHEAASSTLSACRLRQRLMIAQRYFVALGRHLPPDNSRPLIKTSSNGSSGDQRR